MGEAAKATLSSSFEWKDRAALSSREREEDVETCECGGDNVHGSLSAHGTVQPSAVRRFKLTSA